jgi:hypothetical protein
MSWRLPFLPVQDAVKARLRADMPGVQVFERLRVPDAQGLPPIFLGVGATQVEPRHATRTKLFTVTVEVQVVKLDPKGSGVDAEVYGLADRAAQALSRLDLVMADSWQFIAVPWYTSASSDLVPMGSSAAAIVTLVFTYTVQDLKPD